MRRHGSITGRVERRKEITVKYNGKGTGSEETKGVHVKIK